MRAKSLAIRPWQCHGRDWRKCGGIARPAERASEGVAHRSSRGWQVEGQNDPLHARAHPPTNCEVAFNCFYSRIASVTSPTTPGMDLSHPGHLNNPHRVTYKTVPQLCVDAPGKGPELKYRINHYIVLDTRSSRSLFSSRCSSPRAGLHACPQTKHRYEYLAANDTHRDQCHTQYQTNPPRHGFLGGSSQELAAACAASADLAAQRRGSPGRTPSSRSCPRAAAEAPVPCTRRHSSKERRKKLAPGPRAATTRPASPTGHAFMASVYF